MYFDTAVAFDNIVNLLFLSSKSDTSVQFLCVLLPKKQPADVTDREAA
jgi:hypothetical protein